MMWAGTRRGLPSAATALRASLAAWSRDKGWPPPGAPAPANPPAWAQEQGLPPPGAPVHPPPGPHAQPPPIIPAPGPYPIPPGSAPRTGTAAATTRATLPARSHRKFIVASLLPPECAPTTSSVGGHREEAVTVP